MNQNNWLVSVVIPAYNVENYISQSIRSVLDQTFNNWELIVIDDGSKDRTGDVCAQFSKHIKYYRQVNSGVAAARNKGVELARGDLIALLDADDYWYPNKLEKQIELFKRYPDLDLVTSNYNYLTDEGDVLPSAFERNPLVGAMLEQSRSIGSLLFQREQLPEFLMNPFGHPSLTIFRKSLFKKVGGYCSAFTVAEDVHFQVRYLAASCAFGAIFEPLGVYRIRSQSATRNDNARGNEQTVLVYRELLRTIGNEHRDLTKALRYRLQTARLDLIYGLAKSKRRCDALREVIVGLASGWDGRLLRTLVGILFTRTC